MVRHYVAWVQGGSFWTGVAGSMGWGIMLLGVPSVALWTLIRYGEPIRTIDAVTRSAAPD